MTKTLFIAALLSVASLGASAQTSTAPAPTKSVSATESAATKTTTAHHKKRSKKHHKAKAARAAATK